LGSRVEEFGVKVEKRIADHRVEAPASRGRHSVVYGGTTLEGKCTPLGPYRRPVPRVLGGVLEGRAFSYGRGNYVSQTPTTTP